MREPRYVVTLGLAIATVLLMMGRRRIGCSSLRRTGWLASSALNGEVYVNCMTIGDERVSLILCCRTNNATIEVIIEADNFNNSLAGSLNCPSAYNKTSPEKPRDTWVDVYLKNGRPSPSPSPSPSPPHF